MHIQALKPKKRIVPFKEPERFSEEGKKEKCQMQNSIHKESHKHLKGEGQRILKVEDSKVKTQKID